MTCPYARLSCALCGASGVKLWRPYGQFYRAHRNRCQFCAELREGRSRDANDQIGWMVPLILDEKGLVWGYVAGPKADRKRWDALPVQQQGPQEDEFMLTTIEIEEFGEAPSGCRNDRSEGWVRIGRYCTADRRSLWLRRVKRKDDGVLAIELAAGREGGDSFARYLQSDSRFAQLHEVLMCAVFAAST